MDLETLEKVRDEYNSSTGVIFNDWLEGAINKAEPTKILTPLMEKRAAQLEELRRRYFLCDTEIALVLQNTDF